MEEQIINRYKEIFIQKIQPILEKKIHNDIRQVQIQHNYDQAERLQIFNKQRFLSSSIKKLEEEQKYGSLFLIENQERQIINDNRKQKEKFMRIFVAINDLYRKYKKDCYCKNQTTYKRVLTLIQ